LTDAEIHESIWDTLTGGLPAVITSHVRLDGDGIGSALALWHGLRDGGVDTRIVFQPPVPGMFGFLPGLNGSVDDPSSLPAAYNVAVVDCGTFARVGEIGNALAGRRHTINIDHHESNTFFGDLNYVDPGASSSGEMIRSLFCTAGIALTHPIAECLFAAIVSDTGQFSHQDTTPQALNVCAECIAAGARPDVLVRRLFMAPSPGQVRLRQLALGTLEFYCDQRVSTMTVTEEMFRQTGLGPLDTEGFADIPISIQGVQASALLKEMPGCDYVKVSLRSRGEVDVCQVAELFGGGGHAHAAGCEIGRGLEETERIVVDELCDRCRRVDPAPETRC
jgi:phosphoesterase RecJ-like protein